MFLKSKETRTKKGVFLLLCTRSFEKKQYLYLENKEGIDKIKFFDSFAPSNKNNNKNNIKSFFCPGFKCLYLSAPIVSKDILSKKTPSAK